MRLSQKLKTTIANYETAIRAHTLTPREQARFDEMLSAFESDPMKFVSGAPTFATTVQPDPENAACREHALSAAELDALARDGVLPPRRLPVELKDECEAIVDEFGGIYDRPGGGGIMQQLQFFHPRASRRILDCVGTFADIACQAMGCERDQLVFDAQVFSSRLPAPLHCDFPSHTFFDLDNLPQLLQFHINLRLPSEAAGLCFFPGTHKRILFPRAALRLLVESGIDFDAELALKSLVLGERCSMQELNNLCAEDALHILNVPDGKGGTLPVHDFLVGLYCTFVYLARQYSAPERDVEGKVFESSLHKFVMFNPSILHCTDEDCDAGELSRISVAVRVMALPDARALQAGPVLVNRVVRWAYRNLVGVGLDKLGDSCVTFEDLYARLPHREVLSRDEVGKALFGKQKYSKDSPVFLSPTLADNVRLPFISFERLKQLNELAFGEMERRTKARATVSRTPKRVVDLGEGDSVEQAKAAALGMHGSIAAKVGYALEQFGLIFTAEEELKPYLGVRLALMLEVPRAPQKVSRFEKHPEGREVLEHRPRITRALIEKSLALPPDTLGGAYARFATERDLNPEFFPELPQLDGDAAYVQAREASTHDLWHVVTGYDTTIPGEAAVLTFLAGQTPSTFTMMVAVGSSLLILCRSPRLLPVLARAYRSGRKAQQLSPLFWERMWELPLDDVRKRLGITPEEHPSVAYAK